MPYRTVDARRGPVHQEIVMVKKNKKRVVGVTKKQTALSVRDQEARKRVIIGVVIASVIVVGVLIAGVIYEYVMKPASPVATVSGERITTEQYQKMVRYQRNNLTNYIFNLESEKNAYDPEDENNQSIIGYYDQMLSQAQLQLDSVGESVLEQMIDDLLIRQGAKNEGITITEEQIDEKIETLFGYQRTPPTPAPTATPDSESSEAATPNPTPTLMAKEDFDRLYTQYVDGLAESAGFTEADYRDLIRGTLLEEAMREVVESRVSTTGEQVWARHILVADAETAQTVLDRLNAGEDFAELAAEFSSDTSNAADGGDLGWFGRGMMVPAFEEVAFSLAVGETSEPVQTDFGYHIIRVDGHEMHRELDAQTLSQLKSAAFDEWLSTARANADILRSWTPDKVPPAPTPAYAY
jgi:parvulin-like peptidyl-prolyl isomerase